MELAPCPFNPVLMQQDLTPNHKGLEERREIQVSPAAITKLKGRTTKAFKNKHWDSKQGGNPALGKLQEALDLTRHHF